MPHNHINRRTFLEIKVTSWKFFDTCNRPYEELCSAARASHERIYDVAMGEVEPFDGPPEYLPRLF